MGKKARPGVPAQRRGWEKKNSTGSDNESVSSVGSFRSKSSRCSVSSASSSYAVAQLDNTISEAFEKGDIKFLSNLIGPKDTICGFLRKKDVKRACQLIPGLPGDAPKVARHDVADVAKKNWPKEYTAMLGMYDCMVLRGETDIQFTNMQNTHESKATREALQNILNFCKDRFTNSDDAEVYLFCELTRREDERLTLACIELLCKSHIMLEVLLSRCLVSETVFTSPQEKKKISKFVRKTTVKHSEKLDNLWREEQEKELDDGCCAVM
eukprot:TRINITY_DN24487_c0_g1_i2.p1 TRINITY_DN24487_c0_g1~~TRINITY_DN24487_c0_g1_i2.p1  ORF type:complete len:268 (+),score=62.96 TRINITY_DN24487_c0_g1_i2:41-844(+)